MRIARAVSSEARNKVARWLGQQPKIYKETQETMMG